MFLCQPNAGNVPSETTKMIDPFIVVVIRASAELIVMDRGHSGVGLLSYRARRIVMAISDRTDIEHAKSSQTQCC